MTYKLIMLKQLKMIQNEELDVDDEYKGNHQLAKEE